jgi:biopolymer transport protein ExbD
MRQIQRRNPGRQSMADINVTPLVDVMLVLLIIFMVTAPMLSMGIDVNLPRVKSKSIDIAEEKMVLTINENKEIFLNKTRLPLSDLQAKLAAIYAWTVTFFCGPIKAFPMVSSLRLCQKSVRRGLTSSA